MTNKDIDSLKLTECQRAKFAVLRMEIPLSVSSRLRTPMETAKFIRESAENPTFELGGLKKEYNCTLPIDALKILIADLIQYCEEKKISEWLLDDLRTYAKEEVFGRQAEPGHLVKADRILRNAGFLEGNNWKTKAKYPIVAMAEALIEKFSLRTGCRSLSNELAHRYGTEMKQSTFSSAKNGQDFQVLKGQFLLKLSDTNN